MLCCTLLPAWPLLKLATKPNCYLYSWWRAFAHDLPIIAGILVANFTRIMPLQPGLVPGLAQFIPASWHAWLLGGSFIAVALWLLIPDKDDSEDSQILQYGAFVASCVLFFLAEIGDKTQIATVLLAATYTQTWLVIIGTTLGMLAANVPGGVRRALDFRTSATGLGAPRCLCCVYAAWDCDYSGWPGLIK